MQVSEKLDIIIAHFAKSKGRFCEIANIAPSTLSSWYSRNTMDYVKVAQAFPQVNAEWLLRDNGPMTGRACQELEPSTKAIAEEDPKHNTSLVSALISQLKEKDNQINNLISILRR